MSVKVRFAPSPTGKLHVGNIRAALLNWLFARQQGGTFVLRLDDTDTERSTEAFANGIRTDLTWLGLTWDETFKQSDRFARYDEVVAQLKAEGRLYPCYDTAEELDFKRKIQRSRSLPPVYDRSALKLTADEIAAYEAEGRKPHWRFKLTTPGRVDFTDLIRGPIAIDLASVSDPILVREDGSYLYTLPSVVDDVDMGITHVVRGEDHVTNSAVQVDIFHALGAKAPEFAHFSLLQGAEGEGLSKRKGSLAIEDFRTAGMEPMAIVSLLGRLGTSQSVEAFTDVQPLIDGFDFSKFGKKPAKFSDKELSQLNARIVRAVPYAAVQDRLDGVSEAFFKAVQPNIEKIADVKEWWAIVDGEITPVIENPDFMAKAKELFPEGELNADSWEQWTNAVKEATGAKGRDLFMPLRQALIGQSHGPDMATLLPLIGREKSLSRLGGQKS